RREGIAGQIDGQEKNSSRLHAARGTSVVPQRQSAAQGNGSKKIRKSGELNERRQNSGRCGSQNVPAGSWSNSAGGRDNTGLDERRGNAGKPYCGFEPRRRQRHPRGN